MSSSGINYDFGGIFGLENYLSQGSDTSLWRWRFDRVRRFQAEFVRSNLAGSNFGSPCDLVIPKIADLIYQIFLVVDIPGIVASYNNLNPPIGFPGWSQLNQYSNLQLLPNAIDGCPTSYHTASQIQDQAYYNAYYNGSKAAYQTQNYGLRACSDGSSINPFSDTQSNRDELFCEAGNPCPDPTPFAYWHNAVAQRLIREATLYVGNNVYGRVWGLYSYIWEEISGKAGKKLTEMIGKCKTMSQLVKNSRENQRYYVPLDFPNTRFTGLVFPYSTMQFGQLRFNIQFESLSCLIGTSAPNIMVFRSSDFSLLSQNTSFNAALDINWIHLDKLEKAAFTNANFDQLISQVAAVQRTGNSREVNIPLKIKSPVIEVIWVVRRQVNIEQCNGFNFSGVGNRDPIVSAQISYGSTARVTSRDPIFFRCVQPWLYHSSIPDCHIYLFSFSMDPEGPQPCGYANWIKVSDPNLNLIMQEGMEVQQFFVDVFIRYYMIFRFIEGTAGNLFLSN